MFYGWCFNWTQSIYKTNLSLSKKLFKKSGPKLIASLKSATFLCVNLRRFRVVNQIDKPIQYFFSFLKSLIARALDDVAIASVDLSAAFDNKHCKKLLLDEGLFLGTFSW